MLDANNKISGFAHPGRIARFHRVRAAVLAQLVATLALIVAIAISAVAVTMEIAEAGVLSVHETGGGVAFAAVLALAVIAVGGLMAFFASASMGSVVNNHPRGASGVAEDICTQDYQR